jgi:hypothetical protein
MDLGHGRLMPQRVPISPQCSTKRCSTDVSGMTVTSVLTEIAAEYQSPFGVKRKTKKRKSRLGSRLF